MQDAAADPNAKVPPKVGIGDLMKLIFSKENFWFDPVFWIIGLLSIYGLTLIIQGFIKNRHSVLMPDETTEQIREMINQRKFKELLEFIFLGCKSIVLVLKTGKIYEDEVHAGAVDSDRYYDLHPDQQQRNDGDGGQLRLSPRT